MRRSIYFVPLVAILLSAPLIAQVGTISGRVMDETGAVLPGVTVTITNLERGSIRTLVSGDEGMYRASALTLGSYEIQAELMGFRTAIRSGITLTVGREAVVDLTLQVGEISERVEVTGEAPLVNTTSATIAELVDSKKIQDLPLNGRDLYQLATLQAGVLIAQTGAIVSGGDSSGAIGRGLGLKMSISGAKTNSNAFLLDGTDVNDYANTTPGAVTGANLGVEAIQEFQVITNTNSAEYGRSAGGTISAVSRSGTNEHHGSLFWFHRNDNLDASNFFDNKAGVPKPEFRRHQFGAAVGGPIAQDKVFYFFNYEGLREVLGVTSSSRVPSLDARNGILVGEPGPISIDPGTQVVLDTYPLPNGEVSGDTARFIAATSPETTQDFFVAKVDQELNDAHSYFVRYTYDDADITRQDGLLINENAATSRRQFLTLNLKSIISPTVINSLTAAFNRTKATNGLLTPIVDLPAGLVFIPGKNAGATRVRGGVATLPGGPFSADLDSFIYNVFQVRDDINWNRGRHSMKFGFNFERLQTNINSTNRENGQFEFNDIKNLLLNIPRRFRSTLPGSDTIRGIRQSLVGFYFQDDIQLTSRLTLNAGLRYEFVTELSEVNGKLSNLRDPVNDAEFTVGKIFENPSLKNFAPRIGLAWDPMGDGKTAIRAAFGIYHDQIISHYFSGGFVVRVPPFFTRANLTDNNGMQPGDFPTGAFETISTVPPNVEGEYFEFEPSQPYAMQFNLNIQRQLPGDTVVTVGYVGYRGVHMKRIAEDGNIRLPRVGEGTPTNPAAVGTFGGQTGILSFVDADVRRNDNFGPLKGTNLDSQTHYHGLQLGLNKRFSQGLQAQLSYTLSKGTDDSSGIFNEKDLSNGDENAFFYDSGFNRGLSDYDVRHNFVFNYNYDLPVPQMSGAAGKFLNGWQWGGIMLAATGNPYSVYVDSDRANSLTGRDPGGQRASVTGSGKIESTGDPDHWFSPDQFVAADAGFLGNLGRNTGRGDSRVTFDMTFTKDTPIDETRSIQFRAEFFNITNRTNFRNPGRPVVFDGDGDLVEDHGEINNTQTTSRQIQLSLKFIF